MVVANLTQLNFLTPIFAFLFVFVLIYALLAKTKLLGENQFVHLLISFMLSIFFALNVQLVDFVKFNSAWFAVFLVSVFMILLLIGLTHGKIDVVQKSWVAWVLIIGLIVFFIISAAYTFNSWTLTWSTVKNWAGTDWFGSILLIVIAVVASFIIARKVKG